MRQTRFFARTAIWLGLIGGAGAVLAQGRLTAQTIVPREPELPRKWERKMSGFQLFGDRDLAFSGFRTAGEFKGCTSNDGDMAPGACSFFNLAEQQRSGLDFPSWFDYFFFWAVPKSEWNKHKQEVPSLANALGKGYTLNAQANISQFPGELLAHDGTLGPFHAGASSTSDGSCLDFTADFIGSGTPLMAVSDCTPTWGSLGWQGTRFVDQDGFLAYAAQVGDQNFRFDNFRVPSELRRNDKFLGTFQTFGFFSDYSADALFGSSVQPTYGNVIPESMGGDPAQPPTRYGWPLGLLAKMDAFSFAAPGMLNTGWYLITVTNNSRDVYGVPLDYDSLYIGYLPAPFHHGQGTSFYSDPANGVVRMATFCQTPGCGPDGGDPMHPGTQWGSIPPNGIGEGFNYGASAIVVLKSPIGDLRNKLFTDPTSPFFGKGDPSIWDDTITFNHRHNCGFHGCTGTIFFDVVSADYEQKQFGMVSSITSDVLGDRAVTDPSDHVAWDTWRWEEFPDRSKLDFNKWVPGNWDYNEDGVPDTLFYDDCSDNSGVQFDPVVGYAKKCSVAWSDTMSSGFGNVYGNFVSILSMGPIKLPADSTVEFVLALVHANDSTSIENDIRKAIDHYMAFYLGPEPAPPPKITSVEVEQGGARPGAKGEPGASVTLYFDATTEDWEDPFLKKFLNDLLAAPPGTDLGNIRLLNPWLEDSLRALIPNNVAAIHVFKSCDGGNTFTDDDDCMSDPATSGGIFGDVGWLPLATLEPDASGDFVNSFHDDGVFGGRTFLYSLVPQTRGLEVTIINGVPDTAQVLASGDTVFTCVSECRSEVLSIAPTLLARLATATGEPNVASVYIPVSQQAGSARATVELVTPSPDFVPFERMNVKPTRDDVLDGQYRLLFADEATVTEVSVVKPTETIVLQTTVQAVDGGTDTLTLTAAGPVAVEGPFTETVVADTVTRVWTFSALSAVLADANDTPIMVTASLSGGQTVPGRYFGLPNFPGFTMSIDNTVGGQFKEQFYLDQTGTKIGPLVEPAVTFLVDEASDVTAEGRYRLTWTDQPFGSASPFKLDFRDPEGTRDAVVASLTGRTEGQTAATDATTAGIVGLDPADLIAARLPFRLENITDPSNPTPVTVVVPRSGKATNLLLGNGLDTLNVTVPETEWIPGDQLILVEGTNVTFGTAVFGCVPSVWLRLQCNPVDINSRGGTGYIPPKPGHELHYSYYQTITSGTEYVFAVQSAVAGVAAMDSVARIRSSLDSIKVVPNPFIMFSQYSTSGGQDRIIFTHMPPQGVLRIFTVAGQFVQEIRWGPEDLNARGDLFFNLRTREGNEMAAGLYLYVVSALDEAGGEIGTAKGKFVIIK